MKILLIAVAYLLGSTPFGYLIVKLVKGKDIRNLDSGATGTTNVYRQLGPYWAALVAFCDVTKAYLPTRIAVQSWPNEHGLHMLIAIAASLGHSKSLFLGFKGGKAVSTSTGSFIALAAREPKLWDVFKFSLGVFLGAIMGSRGYVSLGSVSSTSLAALHCIRLSNLSKVSKWYALGVSLLAGYISFTHRENLVRILKGTEPKIGKDAFLQMMETATKILGRL